MHRRNMEDSKINILISKGAIKMKELLEKASLLNLNLEQQKELKRRIEMLQVDIDRYNRDIERLKKEEQNLISKIEVKVKQGIDIEDEK